MYVVGGGSSWDPIYQVRRHPLGRHKSWKSPRYLSWFRTTSIFVLALPIAPTNVYRQPPTRLRGRVDLVRVVPGQIPL